MAVDQKYSSIILKRVFESQNPSELVELISDDEKRIPIHRVVLTAASKHFAESLEPISQEVNRKEFLLKGTDGATLRTIVNYCYTGLIELTQENVQTFSTIASMYQLDLLEEMCHTFSAEIARNTHNEPINK